MQMRFWASLRSLWLSRSLRGTQRVFDERDVMILNVWYFWRPITCVYCGGLCPYCSEFDLCGVHRPYSSTFFIDPKIAFSILITCVVCAYKCSGAWVPVYMAQIHSYFTYLYISLGVRLSVSITALGDLSPIMNHNFGEALKKISRNLHPRSGTSDRIPPRPVFVSHSSNSSWPLGAQWFRQSGAVQLSLGSYQSITATIVHRWA